MSRAPFNNHLGIRLKQRHKDGVTIECPIRPESSNLVGTLHGGITATLADVAGGFATLALYGERPLTTVELKLNYFSSRYGRESHRAVSSAARGQNPLREPGGSS